MSDADATAEPVLFAESGSSLAILAFGPAIAVVGVAFETLLPGGASIWLWLLVGLLVLAYTALLVSSRRRFLRVELTPSTLTQGTRTLPTSQVSSLRPADEEHHGVRVLGDGPVVPRRRGAVVLRLTDGVRVVAWARDADGLRRAVDDLLRARAAERAT